MNANQGVSRLGFQSEDATLNTFQLFNLTICLIIGGLCILAFGNAAVAANPFKGDFTLQAYCLPGLLGFFVSSLFVRHIMAAVADLLSGNTTQKD